jgi:hypothetical protein
MHVHKVNDELVLLASHYRYSLHWLDQIVQFHVCTMSSERSEGGQSGHGSPADRTKWKMVRLHQRNGRVRPLGSVWTIGPGWDASMAWAGFAPNGKSLGRHAPIRRGAAERICRPMQMLRQGHEPCLHAAAATNCLAPVEAWRRWIGRQSTLSILSLTKFICISFKLTKLI